MADPYRQAETGGRPHWFCNFCGRDFTTETAAQFHAETTHGMATGPAAPQGGGRPSGDSPIVEPGPSTAVRATPARRIPEPEPPRPGAPKGKWVAYAEALGIDTVDDDGRSLTKQELIERTTS